MGDVRLTAAQAKQKAKELVECLQMWGIEKNDAAIVIREMAKLERKILEKDWINPLDNTGMTVKDLDAIQGKRLVQ